jgi:POT family proton-dependent oligopeptide transporter
MGIPGSFNCNGYGTVTFFILKNKYVVTPEGRPIGGLPKNNTTADFEEGESQTQIL